MAEWLYEAGIGENRAVLVDEGDIVEAAIELPDTLRAGTVAEGRLTSILVPGRRGIVMIAGEEALFEPLPRGLTEGQTVTAIAQTLGVGQGEVQLLLDLEEKAPGG